MTSNSLLEIIKAELAENYREDEEVLFTLIDEAITIALSISNRQNSENNISLLSPYITDYVIAKYLQRGGESVSSLSEGGVSSNFIDAKDKIRKDIIRDGLRVIF